MKKRNVATAMAAAMTLGAVPAFAAPIESGQMFDVAFTEGKEVETGVAYANVYDTKFTPNDYSDDTVKAGITILDFEEDPSKKVQDRTFTIAKSMSKEDLESNKSKIADAKITLEDTIDEIKAKLNIKTTINGVRTNVYTLKKNVSKTTSATIEVKLEAHKDVKGKYADLTYYFQNVDVLDMKDVAEKVASVDVTLDPLTGETTTQATAERRAKAHKEVSTWAYELSKVSGKIKVETKETNSNKDLQINVYKKDDKSVKYAELTIKNFADFDKYDFVQVSGKNDFAGHWAEDQIFDAMYSGRIDNSTQFRPEDKVTRAEFAKILVNAFDIKQKNVGSYKNPFSDVKEGSWEYDFVMSLSILDLVEGDGDGTFRPNDNISRQEAAKMVAAVAANQKKVYGTNNTLIKGETFDSKGKHEDVKTSFKDDAKIQVWADESVKELSDAKVIKGYAIDNTFRPENGITRAESIVMMERAAELKTATK